MDKDINIKERLNVITIVLSVIFLVLVWTVYINLNQIGSGCEAEVEVYKNQTDSCLSQLNLEQEKKIAESYDLGITEGAIKLVNTITKFGYVTLDFGNNTLVTLVKGSVK